jgi:hypothetical protein
VASRLKAGLATGLVQRCNIEGGDRGTEGGDVDGTTSREAGLGMSMGVGDDDGGTAGGVEAEGRVGNRVGDGAMRSRTVTGVEDDVGGTTGDIEAEGGVGNRVDAMGLGMARRGQGRRWGSGTTTGALPVALRLKVGSAMGLARWHGVEGGGRGIVGGGIDGAASREAAAQRAGNLGSLTAQTKISPRLGFHVGGVTPLIPDTLLVSADIMQPIPKM